LIAVEFRQQIRIHQDFRDRAADRAFCPADYLKRLFLGELRQSSAMDDLGPLPVTFLGLAEEALALLGIVAQEKADPLR